MFIIPVDELYIPCESCEVVKVIKPPIIFAIEVLYIPFTLLDEVNVPPVTVSIPEFFIISSEPPLINDPPVTNNEPELFINEP